MEQIGRYRILGELGRGAMGVVYKAEDPSIGRIVAIKTIRVADAATDRERRFLRDRLFREARSAGMLNHAGIVTIYDIQEQGDYCYVFMEFVDGPTLEKLIGAGELTATRVLDVLEQAAAAMDYAHSRGIVHRDIKPANLMIGSDGTVKITDFGVAKFTSQQATNTGVVLGTPSYMSPEQIADQKITGAADQFALAVIAYQLLTGERPFLAGTLPSLMFKIVHDEPAPASRLNSTLGAAADVVLKKALSKKPNDRYADCKQFIKALKGALDNRPDWQPMQAGAMESLETVAERMEPLVLAGAVQHEAPVLDDAPQFRGTAADPPPRKRSMAVALVAAAAAIALIASGAWWYWHQEQQQQQAVTATAAGDAAANPLTKQVATEDLRPSAIGPPAVADAPAAGVETPSQQETTPPPPPPPAPPKVREQVTVRQVPKNTPPESGSLRVITNPPGARIVADGNPSTSCQSPCDLQLDGGRHTLVATLDGYRTESRILSIPKDEQQVIVFEKPSGTVMVRSTPAGATIFVDGQERREKTPAVLTLTAGKHKIAVFKEGFRREEQEIEVRDGAVTNLNISWTN